MDIPVFYLFPSCFLFQPWEGFQLFVHRDQFPKEPNHATSTGDVVVVFFGPKSLKPLFFCETLTCIFQMGCWMDDKIDKGVPPKTTSHLGFNLHSN